MVKSPRSTSFQKRGRTPRAMPKFSAQEKMARTKRAQGMTSPKMVSANDGLTKDSNDDVKKEDGGGEEQVDLAAQGEIHHSAPSATTGGLRAKSRVSLAQQEAAR